MRWTYGLVGLMATASVALAQQQPTAKPDVPAAAAHVERATKLAGNDLPKPLSMCSASRLPGASYEVTSKNWLEPTKVFDNLYFVGSQFVGVWIVQGSDGLVLLDAMGSTEDARDRLVPGMKKLGLDPAKIKYVFATHGHWDHYGGAQYLRDTFGARVGLSEADWNVMAAGDPKSAEFVPPGGQYVPPPKKDLVVTDGFKATVGDTTVTMYVTPGHSPGTISAIVPVREGGKTYHLSLLGGTAFPVTLEPNVRGGGLLLNSQSVQRLAKLSKDVGATGIINTHVNNDGGYERLQKLAVRKPGEPHPFLIGEDAVARHYGVFDACIQAAAERLKARSAAR